MNFKKTTPIARSSQHLPSGKLLVFIFPVLLLLNAGAFCQVNPEGDFKKLEWLAGSWNRTNVKPGQTGNESWTSKSPTSIIGKGVSLKGKDTIFAENLELRIKDGHIFYVVDGLDNQPPVYFKITQITDDSFVCENPEHDFPKKIAYKLTGKTLKATISDDEKNIDFIFVKTK